MTLDTLNKDLEANLPRFKKAAEAIRNADALLIGAGAGMGVDSGLPDYRGTQGFWKAYPPFRGRTYAEIASPQLMHDDPEQAWGFYGHCLSLYRSTVPHSGFTTIKRWAEEVVGEYFVFTSNIDGHFEKTGYAPDRILEIHGSIHHLQCTRGLKCSTAIWPAGETAVEVDEITFRAKNALPLCPTCGAVSRPNVLMFGDDAWVPMRTVEQENQYEAWLQKLKGKNIVAIEFGAGPTIPTVRIECQKRSKTLIRCNPRDYIAQVHDISLPLNALRAIDGISQFL